jgi:hypothetical protein
VGMVGLLVLMGVRPNLGSVAGVNNRPLDAVLGAVVRNDGTVDYPAVRGRIGTIDEWIDSVPVTAMDNLPREVQLATYINLYNATLIKAVAGRYKPGYSVQDNDRAIFREPLVKLADRRVSLDELENEIIRGRFKEPRVLAALVRGTKSSPKLVNRAWDPDNLDPLLDARMSEFLNDPQRNPIDRENKVLKLAKVFERYAEDFGGKDQLARQVDRWVEPDVANWQVEFVEEDWTLNDGGK